MDDILQELRRYHSVLILNEPFTNDRVESFMKDLDVLYVEWCASYMVTVSHLPKTCKIVCRLHGHEIAGQWMKEIAWSKIDLMIFVNDHPLELFHRAYPSTKVKSTVIQEGVNMEKFTHSPGRGFGKRIGFVGHLRPRKDPLPVINMMSQLPRWSLYVRSDPSAYPKLEEACMNRIKELPNVHHVPRVKDMNEYYHGLDIFVNNSLYESQGIAILEAMASDAYPLIRDWPQVPGVAGKLYSEEAIFRSIDECRQKILSWVRLPVKEKRLKSSEMREFVDKNYNSRQYTGKMRDAIEQV